MRLLFFLCLCAFLAPVLPAQTFSDASDRLPAQQTPSVGATIVDIDGDGWPDLATNNYLYLQDERGFTAVPLGEPSNLGVLLAHVDRDGRMEAYFVQVDALRLWQYAPARGHFVVVESSGLATPNQFFLPQGALWFDANNDGQADLMIGDDNTADHLYRHEGNLRFSNQNHLLPNLPAGTYGTAAADYDRDGDTDLYVALCIPFPEGSRNMLYRNDGDAGFTEVGAAAGVDDEKPGWGVTWLDYDNDGWLDLFIANMPLQNEPEAAGYETLLRNRGDGTFEDVSAAAGIQGDFAEQSWDVAAADFDLDGWLDLVVLNGTHTSRLYRNNGDGTFTDIWSTAIGRDLDHNGVAVGDVDNDGDIDLFIPDTPNVLLLNDAAANSGNHWLSVRLRGVASTPDGLGARVVVTAGDQTLTREVAAGDGMISQNHNLRAHFGVGQATQVDVAVHWLSGTVDRLEAVAADQEITIAEGLGRHVPPAAFALQDPPDASETSNNPTLTWEAAPSDQPITYTLYVSGGADDFVYTTTNTSFRIPAGQLAAGRAYGWAVIASDGISHRTSARRTFTPNTTIATEAIPDVASFSLTTWPNPARGTLNVHLGHARAAHGTLELFNLLGRRLHQTSFGAGRIGPLEVSHLPTGMYLLRVTPSRGPAQQRMVLLLSP